MGNEVWIRKDREGNKVRPVDRRNVDITDPVTHSTRVTLVDSDGNNVGDLIRQFIEAQMNK